MAVAVQAAIGAETKALAGQRSAPQEHLGDLMTGWVAPAGWACWEPAAGNGTTSPCSRPGTSRTAPLLACQSRH